MAVQPVAKPRTYRFTISNLLVLTTVVAAIAAIPRDIFGFVMQVAGSTAILLLTLSVLLLPFMFFVRRGKTERQQVIEELVTKALLRTTFYSTIAMIGIVVLARSINWLYWD